MHALVVVAHPDPNSLTHAVAARLAQAVSAGVSGHSVEIADLMAEGFDPRFTATDHAAHLKQAAPSRRCSRRAGADRPRRRAGAGLSGLLVVDARAAEGLDRPGVLEWLGL